MVNLLLTRQHHRVLMLVLGLLLAGPPTAGSMEGESLSPLLPPQNLPSTYSAEALEAEVRDEGTKQPLADVIVVANWELQTWTEAAPIGHVMVMETVTDAKGRFYFPPWGPKPRLPVTGELVSRDPKLLFFKSGYKHNGAQNAVLSQHNTGPVRKSDWNGKTIKLKKFTGSLEEWATQVAIADHLDFAFRHHDCSWKQIPRMLMAIDREVKPLREKKISITSILSKTEKDTTGPISLNAARYKNSSGAMCHETTGYKCTAHSIVRLYEYCFN